MTDKEYMLVENAKVHIVEAMENLKQVLNQSSVTGQDVADMFNDVFPDTGFDYLEVSVIGGDEEM